MGAKDILVKFNSLYGANERTKAIDLLLQNIDCLKNIEVAENLVFTAAAMNDIELLEILNSHHCDLNPINTTTHPENPLVLASHCENINVMRWLITHGGQVNISWPNKQYQWCHGLGTGIRSGNLEMVKLLVEAGAALDVCDHTNRTPLQWAIDYRRPEIADYLISKGAVESHLGKGYKVPETKSPIVKAIEKRFCPTHPLMFHEVVPEATTVSIRTIEDLNCCGLFTDGMSQNPVHLPQGDTNNSYIELFLPIGIEPSMSEIKTNKFSWLVDWMQKLSRYPFQEGQYFVDPVTIISNGEKPKPLGPGTKMTCWMLLAHKDPLAEILLIDDKTVTFFTMIPIHTKERDYERTHGSIALLEKFALNKVPECVVFSRKSVV